MLLRAGCGFKNKMTKSLQKLLLPVIWLEGPQKNLLLK
jgi:hypothetical protein